MNFLRNKHYFSRSSSSFSRYFSMNSSTSTNPRVALCQFKIGSDKEKNILKASEFIDQTGEVDIIVRFY